MEEQEIDANAVHFVQKLKLYFIFMHLLIFRALSNMNHHPIEEVQQGAGTKTVSMFSKLLNHSSRFVMEGVKNLVPKKHNLPLTKVIFLI